MTQNEILSMAEHAELVVSKHSVWVPEKQDFTFMGYTLEGDLANLMQFAELVAQHEREACLKIAESMSLTDANMNKTWRTGCRDVAEAIRARGQA
jgi:hypothetical protein